jgi:hypothetical protein
VGRSAANPLCASANTNRMRVIVTSGLSWDKLLNSCT